MKPLDDFLEAGVLPAWVRLRRNRAQSRAGALEQPEASVGATDVGREDHGVNLIRPSFDRG